MVQAGDVLEGIAGPSSIKARIETITQELGEAAATERLHLVQERLGLEAELAAMPRAVAAEAVEEVAGPTGAVVPNRVVILGGGGTKVCNADAAAAGALKFTHEKI